MPRSFRGLLDRDPFSKEALATQLQHIIGFFRAALEVPDS